MRLLQQYVKEGCPVGGWREVRITEANILEILGELGFWKVVGSLVVMVHIKRTSGRRE